MFQEEQQNQNRRRRPVCLLILLLGLMLLPIESILGSNDSKQQTKAIIEKLKQRVQTQEGPLSADLTDILAKEDNQEYKGRWRTTGQNILLQKSEGSALVEYRRLFSHVSTVQGIIMTLTNGQYFDDGYMRADVTPTQYNSTEIYTNGSYIVKTQIPFNMTYYMSVKIKRTTEVQQLLVNQLTMTFTLDQKQENLRMSMEIKSQSVNITISDLDPYNYMWQHMLSALLLTFIASTQLYAIVQIFKNITMGTQSREKFSLVSFVCLVVWDMYNAIFVFSLSFQNDQLFAVYIAPTFICCILFSIFEFRILLSVYGAQNQNLQSSNMKCNLLVYGLCFLCYYLLDKTNLSDVLLLLLPFIALGQIYTNAYRSRQTTFDMNFVLLYCPRFLYLLYLKGYSGNIYNLRPSYGFCIGIICLVGLHVGLLYLQSLFGARFIVPKFFLPKTYEYFIGEEIVSNLEEGVNSEDCAICLTPVHLKPENEDALQGEHIGKIMKTPCGHRYHGSCLVPWMQHKMDCPTCRAKLPPF